MPQQYFGIKFCCFVATCLLPGQLGCSLPCRRGPGADRRETNADLFENSQAEVDHVLFQTWKSFGFTGHNNTSLLLVGIVLSFTATRANCNPIITAPAVTVSEYWNSSIVSQLR